MRRSVCAALAGLWIAGSVAAAEAARLPIRRLTSADGLAHDQVRAIVRDARGFLWFGTLDGLSRFDGESFHNYGTQNGLPSASIGSLLAARDGTLWVGTPAGLCSFVPEAPPDRLFRCFSLGRTALSRNVIALFEDRAGVLWAGTHQGLFRVERAGGVGVRAEPLDLGFADMSGELEEVRALAEDRQGCLWAGTYEGLARRCGALPWQAFPLRRRERQRDVNRVFGLLVDAQGRVWASLAYDGVLVFLPGGAGWHPAQRLLDAARALGAAPAGALSHKAAALHGAAAPPAELGARLGERLPRRQGEMLDILPADGLAHAWVRGGLWASPDGTIWIGSVGGLDRFDGERLERVGAADFQDSIRFVGAADRAGNLWFGTEHGGALRLNPHGLVTYTEEDGLPQRSVVSVFVAGDGALYAMPVGNVLCRFDGRRFSSTVIAVPRGFDPGWSHHQSSFQDSRGEWWIATGSGLLRFAAVARASDLARAPPRAIYTTRNGLCGNQVFRLYEDSRGDVWISTLDGGCLTRWRRASDTFERFSAADGLPPEGATAFAEDRQGGLWIGFYWGGLARFKAGRFTFVPRAALGGLQEGVNDLFADSAGRIWIAAGSAGLARIDDPGGSSPRVRRFSTADGLAANYVTCVVEDSYHRTYVCTGRGVDRFDPVTGGVAHFTAADGLANTEVLAARRDLAGDLWFATPGGLSRLTPRAGSVGAPPDAFLMGVRVDGRALPVSQWGAAEIAGVELQPQQRQLEVAFVTIGFDAGEAPRYQHRLSGLDAAWSPPSRERQVVFGALAPGRYQLSVRALAGDGRPGRAARLRFRVLPPWWREPWVMAVALAALVGAAYAGYRFRLAHLLSLERVRTRIATDLHDDLGASLSRISLLSEVAAREVGGGGPPGIGGPPGGGGRPREIMREIGALARELFDATADIVWAIDPRRDDLGSLVARLSEYARDVLGASGASWSIEVPPGLDAVMLAADPRRELFLLLKEAIHNAARHSGASAVSLTVRLERGMLAADVRDDGAGFAHDAPPLGDGLRNMQVRAAALAGRCDVRSEPGSGTWVHVEMPLRW